ncbi:MAG: hypothetical protein JSS34_05465 [Proteobacteria bacterium]|nr:hypothetical protein [Pseudomonadota bacterium]
MKIKKFGLLSASLVVAQLITIGSTQAAYVMVTEPETAQKGITIPAVRSEDKYSSDDATHALRLVGENIDHSHKISQTINGTIKSHVLADGLQEHPDEKSQHQAIYNEGVKKVHPNQRRVLEAMKVVARHLGGAAGIEHINTTTVDDPTISSDKVTAHAQLTHMSNITLGNIQNIQLAHLTIANAYAAASPEKQSAALPLINDTLSRIKEVHKGFQAVGQKMEEHYGAVKEDILKKSN